MDNSGGLSFVHAQTTYSEKYGECRMELWRILPETVPNRVEQSTPIYKERYLVKIYKHGRLIEEYEQ